jgi:hypothetical protein
MSFIVELNASANIFYLLKHLLLLNLVIFKLMCNNLIFDSVAAYLSLYPSSLQEPSRTTADNNSPSTTDERRRHEGNPLPLRGPIPSVGIHRCELAWCTPPSSPMLKPSWDLHCIASFTVGSHATTRASGAVTALVRASSASQDVSRCGLGRAGRWL